MRPIREGDRGAAVEDVQRRLISLGADLGSAGVDGVFLGDTCAAVRGFQRDRGLPEDGEVGSRTWAALVDATFALGDRLLYLRFPYLHGADVALLQSALNALGFSCGSADAIFGAFTEGALRDFQSNTGLAADGIVGPGTVRAFEGLRHVWSDKPGRPPAELRAAPARRATVLLNSTIILVSQDSPGVADRVANLALASEPGARISVQSTTPLHSDGLVIELVTASADDFADAGTPTVAAREGGGALSRRLAVAVASAMGAGSRVVVLLQDQSEDEHSLQAMAVSLLDGLCLGLAAFGRSVIQ